MTISNVDTTTLTNLQPNLDVGDVADPALRLAAFQYIYQEMQVIVSELNSLPTANLQNLSVTAAKLANLAVETGKIAELAVTTAKLAEASVTLAKMAANSVGTSQLVDLSVTTEKIALAAVGVAQLSPGAQVNESVNNALIVALKADIATIYKLATQLGMIPDDETKAEQNYSLLDAFINGGANRKVFLNGKFWTSQSLVMTQANTAIQGNNFEKNLASSCLIGNFVGAIIEIDIPSGSNGSFISGISIDGQNTATYGIKVNDDNFYNNKFDSIYIDKINGVGFYVGEGCYSSKYYNISTSMTCVTGLQIESESNQESVFRDCQFLGATTGGIIGTNDNTKTGLRCIHFDNCDFTSPGQALIFYKVAYDVKFTRPWIEKDGAGVASNYLITLGSSTVKASGISFDNPFFGGNGLVTKVFNWLNADAISFLGDVQMVSVANFIDATNAITTTANSQMIAIHTISPATAVIAKKISELFSLWIGDSLVTQPLYKTPILIDMDSATANAAPNGIGFSLKRRSETRARTSITELGLSISNGTDAADVLFRRHSANTGGMNTGQHFKVDGTWNGGCLLLGTYQLWFDGSGKLRFKNGTPTSDTDGTIVGTQS